MRYLQVQNILKKILDFYVKSSIHVALSVLSLAKISLLAAGSSGNILLLIFIFFGALSAYNFIKFYPLFTTQKLDLNNRLIFMLTLMGLLSCLITFFFLPYRAIIFVALGFVFVLGYAIPLGSKFSNWRNRKGWKLYLVVLSWICLTVGLPLASKSYFDPLLFIKFGVLQGIYILVAILPFEIGDMISDEISLQTLPQRYGVRRVKRIGFVLLGLGLLFSIYAFGLDSRITRSSIFIFVLLGGCLWKSHPKQSVYYSRFWVESFPIFWYLLFYYF